MHHFGNINLFILFILVLFFSFSCHASAGKVQLISIQLKLNIHDYYSQKNFKKKIRNLIGEAADKKNQRLPALVVFPEDVGLMLVIQDHKETLSGVESIEEAIKKMTMKYFFPACWNRLKYKLSWVPALYFFHHQAIAETYFNTFSMLAIEYQMYIVAGSVPLPHFKIEHGQVLYHEEPLGPAIYNTSYLFGPDGKVIGYQDKVHLLELEEEQGLHLTPGHLEDIKVFDTDIGRIGIAICLDAFKEDVIEKLREQNADILIQPSANPKPWDKGQQEEWLEGSYQYTYQLKYFKYAVNPMMNGALFNLSFYGQSSIISRDEHSSVKNFTELQPQKGFLLISDTDDKEEIMAVEVDL